MTSSSGHGTARSVVRRRHDPGLLGYLLAYLVSTVAFSVLLAAPAVGGPDAVRPGDFAAAVGIFWLYAVILGLPFGMVGIPAVHFLCRWNPLQVVHVLAAGAVGCVAGAVVLSWLGGKELTLVSGFGLGLGASTAIGRAAVVPIARRRVAAGAHDDSAGVVRR